MMSTGILQASIDGKYIDLATIQDSRLDTVLFFGLALLVIIAGIVMTVLAAYCHQRSEPVKTFFAGTFVGLFLVVAVLFLVQAGNARSQVLDTVARNIAIKYDVSGSIELRWSGLLDEHSARVMQVELADGRTVTSGTVTIADTGEPTIVDPKYSEDPVPVRVE